MTSAFGRRFRLAGLAFMLGATLGGSACGGSEANDSATFDSGQVTRRAPADDVLHTTRPVEQLAADGARVAILYSGMGDEPCIEIWDVSTGTVDGFPGTAMQCPGVTDDDRSIEITEIALGGERVLWAERESNATTYWSVLTATLTRRAPEDVYYFSSGDNSDVRGLRGDGGLLVFAAFDPQEKLQSRLSRAHPRRASLLRTFPRGVRVVGVHSPAIVVGARKGLLEVLNASGKLLRTLDVSVSEVSAVALSGSRLAVQRGRSLSVYDIRTGTRESEWPMQRGVLADVHGGVAVYLTDTAVHLVRLADGRDVVFSTPTKGRGEGPLRAQLEASGLIYSFVNYTRSKPGHVVFVPFSRLREHLR